MMFLFQLWKEGLIILHPEQLRIITLVLLKNIRDTYMVFIRLLGFSLAAVLAAVIIVGYFFNSIDAMLKGIMLVTAGNIILLMRPSIQRKSYAYINSYTLPLVITTLLLYGMYLALSLNWLIHLLVPGYIFLIFFLMDSLWWKRMNELPMVFFESLRRGYTLYLYNLPLALGAYLGMLIPYSLITYVYFWVFPSSIVMHVLYYITMILMLPLPLLLFCNMYIKRLHDQFDLYAPIKCKTEEKGTV